MLDHLFLVCELGANRFSRVRALGEEPAQTIFNLTLEVLAQIFIHPSSFSNTNATMNSEPINSMSLPNSLSHDFESSLITMTIPTRYANLLSLLRGTLRVDRI